MLDDRIKIIGVLVLLLALVASLFIYNIQHIGIPTPMECSEMCKTTGVSSYANCICKGTPVEQVK